MTHNNRIDMSIKRQVINGYGKRGWVLTRCDGSQRVLTWLELMVWKAFKAWPHDAVQYTVPSPILTPAQMEQMARHAQADMAALKATGNLSGVRPINVQ